MNIRFQDFTDEAQKIAGQAVNIASRYGKSIVDIEHIMLALLEIPDEALTILYEELSLDIKSLQTKVLRIVSRLGQESVYEDIKNHEFLSIHPRGKSVIELAQLEADRLGDKKISQLHLFWAVIYVYANSEVQTAVGRMMKNFGVTPSKVHGLMLNR
jgi:ATP-dependent Clp protease ATP-binding subunit ClpA